MHWYEGLGTESNAQADLLDFLEDTTYHDSFETSDDLTEEKLDQAIFESTYMKPDIETDEFKSI